MPPTCQEPLLWLCASCAHSFHQKEWEKSGRACPACGHKTGEWKCSLCQQTFIQPSLGGTHPCKKEGGSAGQISDAPSRRPALSFPRKFILPAAGGVLFLVLLGVWKSSRTTDSNPPTESPQTQATVPTSPSTARTLSPNQEQSSFIQIQWSGLREAGTLVNFQIPVYEDRSAPILDAVYFFVIWVGTSPDPESKEGAIYLGAFEPGQTFQNRILPILQKNLEQRSRNPIPLPEPHFFVSFGSLSHAPRNAPEIFTSDQGVVAICRAIGTFANKSKMTLVDEFDGQDKGNYEIGLLSPIRLEIEMVDFAAMDIAVPNGETSKFSVLLK